MADSSVTEKRREQASFLDQLRATYESAKLDPSSYKEQITNLLPKMATDISMGNDDPLRVLSKLCFVLLYEEPPRDEISRNGFVPFLLEFSRPNHCYSVQLAAAEALCMMLPGSSDQVEVAMDNGAIASIATVLCRLLGSGDENFENEAIKWVGYAANMSVQCRGLFLEQHGALARLLLMLEQRLLAAETGGWEIYGAIQEIVKTLERLLSYKNPLPTLNQLELALPTISKLINLEPEGIRLHVCVSACWVLAHVSTGSAELKSAIVNANLCPRLILLLATPDTALINPILEIIGSLFRSTDDNAQVLIGNGVLPILQQIIDAWIQPINIMAEVCRKIAGLVIGKRHRIQDVLDANIIPSVLTILQWDPAPEDDEGQQLTREAALLLSHIARMASFQQINNMAAQGIIGALCKYLSSPQRIGYWAAQGLWNVLRKGNMTVGGVNPYVAMVQGAGGFIRLQHLRNQPEVGEIARRILRRFGN